MILCARCASPARDIDDRCADCGAKPTWNSEDGHVAKIYARVLVPSYMPKVTWDHRGGEYCPYVIGSRDQALLTNEALDAVFSAWCENDAWSVSTYTMDEFVQELEKQGYIVYHVEDPGIWNPQ